MFLLDTELWNSARALPNPDADIRLGGFGATWAEGGRSDGHPGSDGGSEAAAVADDGCARSPDETEILFSAQVAGEPSFSIHTSRIDGTGHTRITDGSDVPGAGYSEPAWVTDNQIVVARTNVGGTQIVSYDPHDPAAKTVVLAGDDDNHYRSPAPYLAG